MGKFFGTYERSLDTKNRLLLPSKLFGEFPKRLYMVRSFEGAIALYPEDSFQGFLSHLESLDLMDPTARAYRRLASASILPLDIDSHGRIAFPTSVRALYSLGEEVTLIGMIDHLELFDKAAYDAYLASESGRYEEIAKDLAAQRIAHE